MTNRYHIPLVVVTSDELTREEAENYVESLVRNSDEAGPILQAFVEDTDIESDEADRLIDMLTELDADEIDSAIDTAEEVTEDEE